MSLAVPIQPRSSPHAAWACVFGAARTVLVGLSVLLIGNNAAADPVSGGSAAERAGPRFPLWPGLVVGGAGLAGVAIGIGFAIESTTAADEARELRDDLPARDSCFRPAHEVECTVIQSKLETHDLLGNGSIVAFAVGGALLATGVALFAVSISSAPAASNETPTVTAIAPWFTPEAGGFVVGGAF